MRKEQGVWSALSHFIFWTVSISEIALAIFFAVYQAQADSRIIVRKFDLLLFLMFDSQFQLISASFMIVMVARIEFLFSLWGFL